MKRSPKLYTITLQWENRQNIPKETINMAFYFIFPLCSYYRTNIHLQHKMISEIILTTLLVFIPISSSLESYKFYKGTNASFSFNLKQSINTTVTLEFFTLNSDIPFYVNDEIDHRALRPEQHGRFKVLKNGGENFTVTLSIQNIQEIDSEVYVLCAREVQNGKTTDYIHDAYVNSSKKVLQFKFDLLYITLFSVFSTKIGIIRKLV